MNLKVRINGVEYGANTVQGVSITEEYDETLDSAVVVLDHIQRLDLKPYDDVFIYSDTLNDGTHVDSHGNWVGYPNYNTVYKIITLKEISMTTEYVSGEGYRWTMTLSKDFVSTLLNYDFDSNQIFVLTFDYGGTTREFSFAFEKTINGNNVTLRFYDVNYTLGSGDYYPHSFSYTTTKANIPIPIVPEIETIDIDSDNYTSVFSWMFVGLNEAVSVEYLLLKGKEWETDINGNYITPNLWDTTETTFYRHMLIDQYQGVIINLDEDIRKYTFQLFSETKGLETIQCPNISITQPLNLMKKISVYDYLVKIVEMYSPKIKMQTSSLKGDNIWAYVPKYSVFPGLKEKFGDVYAPDFSLNLPNLKTILAQLMLVKDCIPFVKDNVIYALDITERKGEFTDLHNGANYVSEQMSSNNYCDALKRQYSSALSQDNSTRVVEYLGFRNSNQALLTLDNMQLEFRYPIYKINKIYMCYYKKVEIRSASNSQLLKEFVFLCKQDISILVKLNTERNVLSQDWEAFEVSPPATINELARYKLGTIGYDSGSNQISGWGERYSRPTDTMGGLRLYTIERTYIENIFKFMDTRYPFGIFSEKYILDLAYPEENNDDKIIMFKSVDPTDPFRTVYSPISDLNASTTEKLEYLTIKAKAIFFETEYDAFYNGAVIHSKDNGRDNIVMNDNSSSSLALLEKDGLNQKEKVNRFGNINYSMKARYTTINDIQNLGSVRTIGNEDDIVVYKREYSIFDNYVLCDYAGAKDYVLKNYYTSVFAKHRTHQLMSYGESITRAENRKILIMLSKDKSYYEDKDNIALSFSNFAYGEIYPVILSAFKESERYTSKNQRQTKDAVNYGYFVCNVNGQDLKFASDINVFNCGYSLCFNVAMGDNISGGTYIESLGKYFAFDVAFQYMNLLKMTNVGTIISAFNDYAYDDDYVGAKQKWYNLVEDVETGYIDTMGFYVGHLNVNKDMQSFDIDDGTKINQIYNELLALPKINDNTEIFENITNVIGKSYQINKDNKERIDMTFQIEPITNDKDVVFSEWLMKLSDLSSLYYKNNEQYDISFNETITKTVSLKYYTMPFAALRTYLPVLEFSIPISDFSDLCVQGKRVSFSVEFSIDKTGGFGDFYSRIYYWVFAGQKVSDFDNTPNNRWIKISGNQTAYYKILGIAQPGAFESNVEIVFANVDSTQNEYVFRTYFFGNTDLTGGEMHVYNVGSSDNLYIGLPKVKDKWMEWDASNGYAESNPNETLLSYYNPAQIGDITNGSITYYRNMSLILGKNKISKTMVYDQHEREYFTSSDEYVDITNSYKVSDIFAVQMGNHDEQYIWVDLFMLWDILEGNTFKSVQFWYFDDGNAYQKQTTPTAQSVIIGYDDQDNPIYEVYDAYTYQYAPETSAYKFVFGVNITEEDIQRGYVKIYLSMLSSRDKRVYDENNNEIGEIHNFAAEDNQDYFGSVQIFDENE